MREPFFHVQLIKFMKEEKRKRCPVMLSIVLQSDLGWNASGGLSFDLNCDQSPEHDGFHRCHVRGFTATWEMVLVEDEDGVGQS